MEVIVYQKQYKNNNTIDNFINSIYHLGMKHLASDLLVKNLSPEDIKTAVKKAILASENSGLDAKKHFQPIISVSENTSFLDCRLSRLGYTMVLLNVEPKNEFIANFQVQIAKQVLNKI